MQCLTDLSHSMCRMLHKKECEMVRVVREHCCNWMSVAAMLGNVPCHGKCTTDFCF